MPDNHNVFTGLPSVHVERLGGFLEVLTDGPKSLATLAATLHLALNDLLPIVDGVRLLGFAEVGEGKIVPTDVGRLFMEASIEQRKALFRQQVLAHCPMIVDLLELLRKNRSIDGDRVLEKLSQTFPDGEARQQLATVVEWGRYAELFVYEQGRLRLE